MDRLPEVLRRYLARRLMVSQVPHVPAQ
jgi:hypothetical protein